MSSARLETGGAPPWGGFEMSDFYCPKCGLVEADHYGFAIPIGDWWCRCHLEE